MFEVLREMHFDDGMAVLDINCSTHKYILQYLFLNRINESLSQWKETWNCHKLRLPHGQRYTDSSTSRVQRKIVPKDVMNTCSVNFAQYSELYKLEDEETFQYLFEENLNQFYDDDDDNDTTEDSIQFTIATFELGEDKLMILQQYEPLNLSNSVQECMDRYIECIRNIYS